MCAIISYLPSLLKITTNLWNRCWWFFCKSVSSGFHMTSLMFSCSILIVTHCAPYILFINFLKNRYLVIKIFLNIYFPFLKIVHCSWKGLLQNSKFYEIIKYLWIYTVNARTTVARTYIFTIYSKWQNNYNKNIQPTMREPK